MGVEEKAWMPGYFIGVLFGPVLFMPRLPDAPFLTFSINVPEAGKSVRKAAQRNRNLVITACCMQRELFEGIELRAVKGYKKVV